MKTDYKVKLSEANASLISPNFKEKYNKEIIPYGEVENYNGVYAPNGAYPDKLLALYYNSPLHKGLIDGKVFQITGGGVDTDDSTENFLSKLNDGAGLIDFSSKLQLDLEIFNGFASFITLSKDFSKIISVQHAPYDKIRACKYEEDDDGLIKVKHYYFSNDWLGSKRPMKRKYESFNTNKIKKLKETYYKALESKDEDSIKVLTNLSKRNHTFIYVYNNYTAGRDYYPLPSYVAAINDIDAYSQISVYMKNALKKGMNSDGMLLIPGDSKTEEFEEEAEKIKSQYAGSVNTGELMITGFNDDSDKPEYIDFGSHDQDGRLEQIIGQTTTNILSAHNITSPLLVGIKTPGQLGGSTEIEESRDIFYNNVIKPKQIKLSNYINNILDYMSLTKIKFNKLENINK